MVKVKKPKKLISVNVGISAFNEEKNILFLLQSILSQRAKKFVLEKIYVVSDGSIDKTETIVKKLSQKCQQIQLIADGTRKGKTERINELFELNNSDLLLYFDADILLANRFVIEKLIQKFRDPKVALIASHKLPVKGKNFFETLLNTWYMLFWEIRKDFSCGNNVYNFNTAAFAIRKSLAKKIISPVGNFSLNKFLYFEVIKRELKFHFEKNAYVLFRSPDNFSDYQMQISRFSNINQKIAGYFGDWVYEKLEIPVSFKIRGLIKALTANPILTPLAIGIHLLAKTLPKQKDLSINQGLWIGSQSSKRAITNI